MPRAPIRTTSRPSNRQSLREHGRILVVSCYELGHQPLAAASALACLEQAGYSASALDLSLDPGGLEAPGALDDARLVLVSVPMHTALHIGVRAAATIRRGAPAAHVCFYGLYAALNSRFLLDGVADSVAAGECEPVLVDLARAIEVGRSFHDVPGLGFVGRPPAPRLARTDLPPPLRDSLPDPSRYARLEHGASTHVAAAVETSRGCLHHCRHCPIPPVYGGRFFVAPRESVLEDIRGLVQRGVRHLTFADPDFWNGPGHSMAIVRAMHGEHPDLTFDVTTKVENLLKHRDKLPDLAAFGCLFVVSAVESLSPVVLRRLDKGHSPEDVFEALGLLRRAGISLRPTFVPFTPWTTIGDYVDLLDWVDDESLVSHVDPVQWSIRLLVPPGSLLVTLDAMEPHLGQLAPSGFSYRWTHPDPSMDALQTTVAEIVGDAARRGEPARTTFDRVRQAAYGVAGTALPTRFPPARAVAPTPRLTEPWFC